MRSFAFIAAFVVLTFSAPAFPQKIPSYLQADDARFGGRTPIEVHLGVTKDGAITDTWYRAIKDRISKDTLSEIKATRLPLGPAEIKWLKLVNEVSAEWTRRRARLHLPFGSTKLQTKLYILAGNQIGDDGFTYKDDTICLDLAAFAKNYGDPTTKENADRILRMLDHEYTHLVHHAWIREHPISMETPFDRALRNLWVEGIGNYRSLSGKWVDNSGNLTPLARQTLAELEPVFVDRVTRLRTATPELEEELSKGLSRGPFTKKWGALTVALWLSQEAKGDDKRLAKWVEAGPKGVIDLSIIYLPSALQTGYLK